MTLQTLTSQVQASGLLLSSNLPNVSHVSSLHKVHSGTIKHRGSTLQYKVLFSGQYLTCAPAKGRNPKEKWWSKRSTRSS